MNKDIFERLKLINEIDPFMCTFCLFVIYKTLKNERFRI